MKKYLYILLSLICLAAIIATTVNINEKKKKIENLSESKQTGEKRELNWVKENALYEWNIKEGNKEYEIYLVGEETKRYALKENNAIGKVDDPILEGEFSFYTSNEKDEQYSYKQVIDRNSSFVFNLLNKNKSTLYVSRHTIGSLYQQAEKGEMTALLFTIKNGGLTFLTDNSLPIYDNEIKNIQQNYLQTVSKREEKAFEFTTWELDAKKLQLKKLDTTSVQEVGIVRRWLADEHYYFPFKNLSVTQSIITRASEGMLIGSQYPIGTNGNEIKHSNRNYLNEVKEKDAIKLSFPEVTYQYSRQNEQVTVISIPGLRVKEKLEKVEQMIGNPDEFLVDEKKNGTVAIYHAGNYQLRFLIDNNQIIESLELRKI
ncbi:hypothetical protein [Niallia sp. 03133]|uniref:hypothetical protein n=1 Tax=Niallia sp. 03133 TaxID=3458060 RepID=UPI004044A76C